MLLLLAPVLLVPGSSLQSQGTVDGVVDVYVRPWPRIWRLDPLVDWPLLRAIERSVYRLLLHDPILDIVLLLLVVVLPRSWILRESLPGIWRLSLMLPKLSSLGLGHERLRLLSNKLSI